MAWEDVDLSSIPSDYEVVPEAEYTFELLAGAKTSKFDSERIEAAARVASGEFKGRVMYFSYPDPAKFDWSPGVFLRLVGATGALEEGEKPVEYLNRSAGVRFNAKVSHRMVTDQESGESKPKAELKIGSVRKER